MPDGSEACRDGRLEGNLEAQVAALTKTVDEMRAELKPMLADYQRRQGREMFLRDAGAFFGGSVAIFTALFGLFKYGDGNGWFGK